MIVRGRTQGGVLSIEVDNDEMARRFIRNIQAICPWPIDWEDDPVRSTNSGAVG